jgi:hypothetical protein
MIALTYQSLSFSKFAILVTDNFNSLWRKICDIYHVAVNAQYYKDMETLARFRDRKIEQLNKSLSDSERKCENLQAYVKGLEFNNTVSQFIIDHSVRIMREMDVKNKN